MSLLLPSKMLDCAADVVADESLTLEALADQILFSSYRKGIDLFSVDELCAQVTAECSAMFNGYPGARIRLKAIGGGGGKGQRILGEDLLGIRLKAIGGGGGKGQRILGEDLLGIKEPSAKQQRLLPVLFLKF